MKLQWVIAVCVCWLALLVQPQQCMEFTTDEMGSINKLHDNHNFASSLLSMVLPITTLALKQQQEKMRGYDNNNLVESESKVYITGFNNLCVSVKNDDYHDGNAIVLNKCKEGQENQLWSLSSDQTIRSKEKCLTTFGYKSGDYVMIYDCKSAAPDATKWEIQSDSRKIINPKSGLSLTAEKDSTTGVYNLRVHYYDYVPRQAWLPTNNFKPPVSKIVGGFGALCLMLDGVQTVQMAECGQSIKDEKWVLYPDSTIRPEQHQERCLRYEYGQYVVSVGTCTGWTSEGWVFKDDGIILHVSTGMVMDIKETTHGSPGHFSPYLNCCDGRVSQIWSMDM